MPYVRVNFEPFVDDETNPDESIIAFSNGLPASEPFDDYRGGLIRIQRLATEDLELELYAVSQGVNVHVPKQNLAPYPPLTAFWVRSEEGAWLVLGNCVAGYSEHEWLGPPMVELIDSVAEVLGPPLVWQANVDDQADRLARLATLLGLPERQILQLLLKIGRLRG